MVKKNKDTKGDDKSSIETMDTQDSKLLEVIKTLSEMDASKRNKLLEVFQDSDNVGGAQKSKSEGRIHRKAGRGYYTDPKNGKTYRLKAAQSRPKARRDAEQLVRTAVNNLRSYCSSIGAEYDKDRKETVDKSTGEVIKDEKHLSEVSNLIIQLNHAKKQLKAVKAAFKKPNTATTSKKLDPTVLPTFDIEKKRWADVD